ncbi:imidazole glycerol phosphate synthase subunit HisH [Paenibacillus sp. UNC499MF]|uniref:imidazole glycerol phosphate synthase subunit HisH n=1 Tax=Paenibacillus sp. UNC499MF TaxID=1502751 RepID=UPI00089FB770|nr:imidazole glycerol phosphate synthase subunit HisH [Paenibacillus sp. UNC499MF]SEG79194.1 glutamine amidotransferase [Paenibacillus sp. UNC499MF]
MIAIIDYGMGNLHSVSKAVERLGCESVVSSDPDILAKAEGLILPGVGAFGDAMEQLRSLGLDRLLREQTAQGKPLLGICLGMQLLFTSSEEYGEHEGLNLLPGQVVRFRGDYKVPHMGWNRLEFKQSSALLEGLEEGHVYFVHSYHVKPERQEDLLAVTDYHQAVTAVVGRDTVFGMQFHPEKSGELGMRLLQNFVGLCQSKAGA